VRRQAASERLRACALAACGVLALCARGSAQANPTSASATVYIHTDSDKTTVITPRAHVSAPIGDATRVDLVYTTDVWSSASVDIRTSASKHLENGEYRDQKRVTEQRDEIDVSVSHAISDVTLGATYRYSIENDYESNGVTLGAAYDFADKNSTLALTARAYFDKVGRAGDPGFERDAKTLSARAAFTQIIDRHTLLQGVYELARLDGYLSSPYRFVRIANDAGQVPSTCQYASAIMGGDPVSMCLPERNPELRLRHAIGIEGRRALSTAFSLGVNYRFYIDDWGILSHTAAADVTWVPAEAWLLGLGYRFYTQSAADQYAPFYSPKPLPEFYTSDKELTQLSSHRVQLELMRVFTLDDLGSLLRTVLRVAPAYFIYDNFPLLDSMRVLEVTVSMEVVL
jgi:hypothetical protein